MKTKLLQIICGLGLLLTLGATPTVKQRFATQEPKIRLVVLSPAHPHGAGMQEGFRNIFHKEVAVYAASIEEMQATYLNLIDRYNKKSDASDPWRLDIYAGQDYLEKMLSEKKGDMVIIASNNQSKAEYMTKAAEAGMDILVDKPMALTMGDFEKLENAFQTAASRGKYISDLPSMSMRRFVSYAVQKELMAIPEVFGTLTKGTLENPAVIQKNHHLYWKGAKRPPWFFDVKQQGNGLTDVTTHLIDIVQWSCFPNTAIDYRKDIHVSSAKTWATEITPAQFKKVTAMDTYPVYLHEYAQDSVLQVHSNGEINYTLRGVHVQIVSTWGFESISGERDSYESIISGSKVTLKIKAGNSTDLFIEPNDEDHTDIREPLQANFKRLQKKYPYLSLSREKNSWRISSSKRTLGKEDKIVAPSQWERNNMLAKYYTTISADQVSKRAKK